MTKLNSHKAPVRSKRIEVGLKTNAADLGKPSSHRLPSVSVVIPVHNEEARIKGCLDALMRQTSLPDEIIIVDNNSTDNTSKICKKYAKVRLLVDNRYERIHSRNTGFDAARGDVIVRIDADTIAPQHYIEYIRRAFAHNDSVALSGYGVSDFEFLPHTSLFWNRIYFNYTHAYFGHPTLWGANSAFARKYWEPIKPLVFCDVHKYHEDQDLALALASIGVPSIIDRNLTVVVSMESAQHISKFHKYVIMMRNLKKDDLKSERSRLSSRLPKTSNPKRLILWLSSVWGLYVYYFFAICYSLLVWLKSLIKR